MEVTNRTEVEEVGHRQIVDGSSCHLVCGRWPCVGCDVGMVKCGPSQEVVEEESTSGLGSVNMVESQQEKVATSSLVGIHKVEGGEIDVAIALADVACTGCAASVLV